jgi:hypothetical protein
MINRNERELIFAMKEFDSLIRHWQNRNADQMVAVWVGLACLVAHAGGLFKSENDYRNFVHNSVTSGFDVWEENQEKEEKKDDNGNHGSGYIH